MQTTRLSSKGQIILPKSIRDERSWEAGMEFTVESTENGILLRPSALFPHTEIDEVVGCLASRRISITSDRMRQGIGKEVRRRNDRGRY